MFKKLKDFLKKLKDKLKAFLDKLKKKLKLPECDCSDCKDKDKDDANRKMCMMRAMCQFPFRF